MSGGKKNGREKSGREKVISVTISHDGPGDKVRVEVAPWLDVMVVRGAEKGRMVGVAHALRRLADEVEGASQLPEWTRIVIEHGVAAGG